MRTVDTSALQPLGDGGGGPWRMEGGRLLHTRSGDRPLGTQEEARAVLAAYRAAARSANTPQGHEVVRVPGGFGVVVDFVPGIVLGAHIAIGSYTPAEAGHAVGQILRRFHGTSMDAGRDWNGIFRSWTRKLVPLLPPHMGNRLGELVLAIPERRCLLHGDMHLGNIVVGGGVCKPIDMEAAGFGHPVLDLVIARSRMLLNAKREAARMGIDGRKAEEVGHTVWKALLEDYFEDAEPEEIELMDRRIEVLAEVEGCCFTYGVAGGAAESLSEMQADRVNRCAKRLEQLLPHLDRLDFDT